MSMGLDVSKSPVFKVFGITDVVLLRGDISLRAAQSALVSRRFSSIRFKEELLQLVTSVKEKSVQAGLYLNLKKTKVMSTKEMEEFELDGENVEVVRDFVFLGAKIEDSGSCKETF